MPLAAFAQWREGELVLEARLGHPDGAELVEATLRGAPADAAEAEAMGTAVAQQLKQLAGPAWLAALHPAN